MFKFTAKLGDEWRNKIELLRKVLGVETNKEIFEKMANFFLERDRQDRLDKVELRLEELASRVAFIENKINQLERNFTL